MSGRTRGVLAVVLLLVLAAVAVGVLWARAAQGDALATARARDDASRAAQKVAVALSTLDYRNPDRAVAQWHQVATGDLYDALSSGKTRYQKVIEAGKVTTRATIKAVAPQTLSTDRSTAVVLVALDVRVTATAGNSVEKERLVLTMKHTADGWRASEMKPVAS